MSALLAGAIAAKREAAAPGTSTDSVSPKVSTYVDALAALVPADVLALHALIVGWCTTTGTGSTGATQTVISHATTLKVAFVALLVLGPVLFLAGRLLAKDSTKKSPNLFRTLVQALIPGAAFVAWTMLGQATAFDAIDPGMITAARDTIAVFAAVLLGVAAKVFADQLNAAEPAPK